MTSVYCIFVYHGESEDTTLVCLVRDSIDLEQKQLLLGGFLSESAVLCFCFRAHHTPRDTRSMLLKGLSLPCAQMSNRIRMKTKLDAF